MGQAVPTMHDALYRSLCDLKPQGSDGFEGFVHTLLERLSGSRFFHARSGSQGGKDFGTAGYGDDYICVECKRYARGTSPTTRELLGEMSEADIASSGQLDVWILVTTGAIGTREAEILRQAGDRQWQSVEIIDWQDAGLPELAVLCAAFPEETLTDLQSRGVAVDLSVVCAELERVASDPAFPARIDSLRNRLRAPELGLDQARRVANAWIDRRLRNRDEAVAAFRQALCVDDSDFQTFVRRPAVIAGLQGWYADAQSRKRLAAVLGGEGNGKSWAALGWWRGLDEKPLTLVITSNGIQTPDLLDTLASALTRQTETGDESFWGRRVRRWLRRSNSETPVILLIVDGLNERPRFPWDQFFSSFGQADFSGRIAVLATCRPAFWHNRVARFLPGSIQPISEIPVRTFTDEELALAWGELTPPLSRMSPEVREFIRIPRVLRLARKHISNLISDGDLTIERLLVEDWQDRQQLKPWVGHSAQDFNDLVVELARDFRTGVREFGRHDLRRYSSVGSSPDGDLERDLEEILAGRLFEPVGSGSSRYRIRPQHVGLALGALLAREVEEAYRRGGVADVEGAIARTLDPVSGFDQVNPILKGACAVAWLQPDYPDEARRALLRTWPSQRNVASEEWKEFAAYIPINPATIFDLAEELWGEDAGDNYATREWITDSILRWRTLPSVCALMEERCVRWLGTWHADWSALSGRADAERVLRQRETVKQAWARLSDTECRLTGAYLHEGRVPDAPNIARLALLLISFSPRGEYVKGFIAWALSRAVMNHAAEYDEIAWCVRCNDYDPRETENALLLQIEPLLRDCSDLGARAARQLLTICGTRECLSRLQRLPAPPPQPALGFFDVPARVDPCDPATHLPDPNSYIERVRGLDIDKIGTSLGMTVEEHELREVEPFLARCAPAVLADTYRQILRSARARSGIRLRQLGWRVPEYLLLIGDTERAALNEARAALQPVLEANPSDAQVTEAYLLLGILPYCEVERQLEMLLGRPAAALDLLSLGEVLKPVPAELANARLQFGGASPHALRRLLWILSYSRFALTEAARERLVASFRDPDPVIRAFAFRLAEGCGDRIALQHHAASSWSALHDDKTVESFYGSCALIAGAEPVDYCALRGRIDPMLLGYLVLQDGRPEAVDEFALDLDALWDMVQPIEHVLELEAVLVLRDAPSASAARDPIRYSLEPRAEAAWRTIRVFGKGPNREETDRFFALSDPTVWAQEQRKFDEHARGVFVEARKLGLHFIGRGMRQDGLEEVARRHPELVEKWIREVRGQASGRFHLFEFYLALCAAIGPTDPDLAGELLSLLRDMSTGGGVSYSPWCVDSVTWHAFHLPATAAVGKVRNRILGEAHTDALVCEIVLAALAGRAEEWLKAAILRDVDAASVHRIARAMTLVGFLDEGDTLESVRGVLEGRQGFLAEVASCNERRLARNRHARTWFTQFLTLRDAVEAWAAFRLFLRCVDRRFYVWGPAMQASITDLPTLWAEHLAVNDWQIRQAAEKNEERLSDVLFGVRVSKDEVAPWYNAPTPIEVDQLLPPSSGTSSVAK